MQAGARSSAPLRAGRCQDQQSEILLTTNPTDTSKPAAIHPPKRCPTAPGPPHVLPSLVVADRQAAKAMTMESEDVRSPCAHAMVRWGRQLRDGAAAVVSAPLRASARSYGTRRLMQRHFAHIARIHTGERLGGEGAACLSPLASQWGGWALQRAPLPAPHAHAGLSRSIPTAGSRSPPAIPPSLDAVLPVIPLCGSGPAAVKAEPSAQRCGHAACPGPARGMEELSEGTELLRGFPSGWQNRGTRSGSGTREGGGVLQFWCTRRMRTHCMCSPYTSRAGGTAKPLPRCHVRAEPGRMQTPSSSPTQVGKGALNEVRTAWA